VFHDSYLDPIASVLIALLLAAVSLLLGCETGALLAGERTKRNRIKQIRETITAAADVESMGDLLSM